MPVPELSVTCTCRLFNGWFGVSFHDSLLQTHIRAINSSEILTLYNLSSITPLYPSFISSDQIRNLVLYILPSCLFTHISDTFLSYILPPPIPPPILHQSLSSCFTLQPLLAQDQWSVAYGDYSDTYFLMKHLRHNDSMHKLCVNKLVVTYRHAIANNLLCIINDRTVYIEPVTVSTNHICCIIVPLSLQRIIFIVLHASPVAGHMGDYKTSYRLKLRLFWPRMMTDIKDWIKQCPHCMLMYKRRRQGQEVMFSCPVSSPFAILHADLWVPGHFTDNDGDADLMNVMCDMTKFVVVVPVPDETSATLAEYFMQHVLLKFGICHLLI